ncbi:MAG: DEAD/DEAH box helicase, partial [Bacteroidota bacterium]
EIPVAQIIALETGPGGRQDYSRGEKEMGCFPLVIEARRPQHSGRRAEPRRYNPGKTFFATACFSAFPDEKWFLKIISIFAARNKKIRRYQNLDMTFQELNLIEPILKALEEEGYTIPTPIQAQAIPVLLQHKDLLGCAQTGTGKTAAFAIPILQILHAQTPAQRQQRKTKALILTPTRELAIQIGDSFSAYGRHTGLRNLVIFGGVSQVPQVEAIRRGTEILVATPGRLLDLINQRLLSLQDISLFVLDEADRMLDMGFIHDVKKVIQQIPKERQTLLFSATMPAEIAHLADSILKNPVKVAVTPVSSTVEAIEQAVYFVEKNRKKYLLIHLLKNPAVTSALVFTRTKHGANRVAQDLTKAGVKAEAIHGNKSQGARQAALGNFKASRTRVLVATDIAARGIDLEELSHVINFDLPNIPETYVHRIGRTGRAGASGIALSFCDDEEKAYLRDIQKLIGKKIPVVEAQPFIVEAVLAEAPVAEGRQTAQRPDNQQRRGEFSRQNAQPAERQQRRGEAPKQPSEGQQRRGEGERQAGNFNENKPSQHENQGSQQKRGEDSRQPKTSKFHLPHGKNPAHHAPARPGGAAENEAERQASKPEKTAPPQRQDSGNRQANPSQRNAGNQRFTEKKPASQPSEKPAKEESNAWNSIIAKPSDPYAKKGFTIRTEPNPNWGKKAHNQNFKGKNFPRKGK